MSESISRFKLNDKKLRLVLTSYKQHFAETDAQERYKWEALHHYQQHWDMDAPDFPGMLAEAFRKTGNLLASGMYYPLKMLLEYAQAAPETVRQAFRNLHDETQGLSDRYDAFRKCFRNYLEQRRWEDPERTKGLQHYQDLRAVMVYLTFQYPEKYYLYKTTMYKEFRQRMGYTYVPAARRLPLWKVTDYMNLCDQVLHAVQQDAGLIAMHKARLDENCYQDEALHLLVMDIIYYSSTYMQAKDFYADDDFDFGDLDIEMGTDVPLNTILYGPPGTGKTWHTVLYAVAAIEDMPLKWIEDEPYADVLARYNDYKAQGRVEFATFHQSYGYEEFIEGIKPVVDEEEEDAPGELRYTVQPGVFKTFCEKAGRPAATTSASYGVNDSPVIWKVSLNGTGDNPIRTECMQKGHIRIGWDEHGETVTKAVPDGWAILNAYINKMQVGDVIFSCYSATTIDAIGVVTGDYEWHDEYPSMKRLRKVNWLAKNIRENIVDINGGKTMTLSTVYKLNIDMTQVYRLIEKYQPAPAAPKNENYVFIIDEINRGNISRVFGELITLIEDAKRIGQPEGTTVRLPYSQKPFGVPKNVYLIGTMNTADRSIAAMDTALRRRFQFREMLPAPEVLAGVKVDGLPIDELLIRMNQRITVLYDREHTLGHAYFLPLKEEPTLEKLADIFSSRIIPLLQEYFFEDYGKIRLVLGDNRKQQPERQFIRAIDNDYEALFGEADIGLDESCRYEINDAAFDDIEAYQGIL